MRGLATISVIPEVWALFCAKYPRTKSQVIQSFVKDLVNSSVDIKSDASVDQLKEELEATAKRENSAHIRKKAILEQINEMQEKEKSVALSPIEEAWLKKYGVNIFKNKDFQRSYSAFIEQFNRSEFDFKHYKNLVMEHIKQEGEA